jgi:hypothetical protein
MSVNKYQPHVMVLPEDDANSQLATGFQLRLDPARLRQMQVLPVAGGWIEVLDRFESDHVAEMGHNSNRLMVLLVDFDGNAGRLDQAKRRIPGHLTERVFIPGALSEPEELKARLGTYEAIGSALAQDCREETDTIWGACSSSAQCQRACPSKRAPDLVPAQLNNCPIHWPSDATRTRFFLFAFNIFQI